MLHKQFLSFSLSLLCLGTLGVNKVTAMVSSSEAIASENIKLTTAPSEVTPAKSGWIIGFGLGDLLNIEDAIENKVDRVESNIRSRIPNILQPLIPEDLFSLERERLLEFSNYFKQDLPEFEQAPEEISSTLGNVARMTGHRYAMIYVSSLEEEGLEFLLFAPDSPPQTLYSATTNQEDLAELVSKLRSDIALSLRRKQTNYLETSQEIYDGLIGPIEEYLESNQIDGLIFSLGEGLRSTPLAALHDGDRYLVEDYSLAVVPSFYNISSDYSSLQNSPVLAMGADSFTELEPLPGVGLEVEVIANLTRGKGALNEEFTVNNFKNLRSRQSYPIVHLATHAQFNAGSPKKSSIYLWDDELRLNELKDLSLDSPQVDLLVLSACQTALGSREAELGFSGLTIASGSKSALESLWSVSDSGTLVLMQNFYNNLSTQTTKAEALRQAQLEMLRGDLSIVNGLVRRTSGAIANIQVSGDPAEFNFNQLVHPYYWSGFTLVGRPW